ncbi:NAD-dependent epimerase/dehydratase family protein, partial [Planktomarina temperata]|nr:NAD-dependent epimerase/dehydratase family protein [Planktomarina temperata]
MKNILITGAGGYIGIPLTAKLLNEGYSVTALDRYFFGSKLLTNNLKDLTRLRILKDDIRNLNVG